MELLVSRSIVELKSEILNLEMKKVRREIAEVGDSDPERIQELLSRLSVLMKMRSAVAQNIGERIISPR